MIDAWWELNREELIACRRGYTWPPGVTTAEALRRRETVAQRVRDDARRGVLERETLSAVLKWGFNNDDSVLLQLSDGALRRASGDALRVLRQDRVEAASLALMTLPGIGISRASKFLALTDEHHFGIYDSRVGRGLDDLRVDGSRLVEIPPGRGSGDRGTTSSERRLAQSFERCVHVFRAVVELASRDSQTSGVLKRPADVEMALFMRGGRHT